MILADPNVRAIEGGVVRREMKLMPSMCGHSFLFVSQIGDWMWDAVTRHCETNVFEARNEHGLPAYLAFYYLRMRTAPDFHFGNLRFGLDVGITTQLYSFGSESVLALHRLGPLGTPGGDAPTLTAEEFYERPQPGCMYFENCNRWISRSAKDRNEGLVRASPPDFAWSHLPTIPEAYSPRPAWAQARQRGSFFDATGTSYQRVVDDHELTYQVDASRDVNAVKLIYFSAFISIMDWGMLQLWRHLGRTDDAFLNRTVVDHRTCFLSNVERDGGLRLRLQLWRNLRDERDEIVNIEIFDQTTGRTVLVTTVRTLREPLERAQR